MIRLIILFFIPSLCFSQTSPVKAELIIFKDSIERFESFEYCMKFKNVSEDSLVVSPLFAHVLEVKKEGEEWQPLWKSEYPLFDNNGWFPTRNLMTFGILRSIDVPKGSIFQKHIKHYFPLSDSLHPMLFIPEMEYEIRLKRDFGEQLGVIYSEPTKIYIKRDNLFNLDFINELNSIGLGVFYVYAPWEFISIRKSYPIDNEKIKLLIDVIEKHPNSDFYDWVLYKKKIIELYYKIEDENKMFFNNFESSLLLRMLSNEFYPYCLILNKFDSNLTDKHNYVSTYETILALEKLENKRKSYGSNCYCN